MGEVERVLKTARALNHVPGTSPERLSYPDAIQLMLDAGPTDASLFLVLWQAAPALVAAGLVLGDAGALECLGL